MARTFTVGIYYIYLEGSEGSSDTERWHENWHSWCLTPITYETGLLADYTGGSMPIQWVKSFSFRARDIAGGESVWTYGGILAAALSQLSSFGTVDVRIGVFDGGLWLANQYPGLSTILVRGSAIWQTLWGKRGISPFRNSIQDYVAHELGHLFGLKDSYDAANKPCPMVVGVNWESYSQWLGYGQQLWFHPEHRIQLLESWGGFEPPTITVLAASNIQSTTVRINAVIKSDGGEACEYRFRYAKPLFIRGDANGDGVVNALDITKIERIIVGLDAETPGADANGNGVVNALDITKVERIIAGLDAAEIVWGNYTHTSWTGAKTTGQTFYEDISSLSKNTLYKFNAQAKNSAGVGEWGAYLVFNTLATVPGVTTQDITDVETTIATGGSDITDTGGQDPDEEGICWNTCGNPTVADNKSKKAGSFGKGKQYNPLTGLIPGETYYICGFATNLTGTGYGSQVVLTHNPGALIVAPLASIDSAGEVPVANLGVTMLPYTVPISYVVNPIPTFTRDTTFGVPALNIDGLALIPIIIQVLPPTAGIDSEVLTPSLLYEKIFSSPLVSVDSGGLVPEIFGNVWVIIDVPTAII